VRLARGVDSIPARFRDAPEQCTHCSISRKRNRTFVVSHADEGFAQLGSTCLESYLGPESLRAWLTWGALQDAVDEFGGLGWDEDEFACYRGRVEDWGRPIDPMTFLRVVCAESRVHGFSSAGGSLTPDMATGRLAWSATQRVTHEPVTSDDVERADQIWTHIKGMPDNDFAHNIQTIAGSMVKWSDANTFAYAYASHAREAARLNEHIHHAPVGAKVVLDLTIVGMPHSDYEGEFGWVRKYYIKMVDVDGRTVVWPTTAPNNSVDGDGLAVGEKYRIVAKIKALGSYHGMAETTITARAAGLRAPGEVTKSAPIMRKWAKASGFDCPEWAWTKAQQRRAEKA
jgi:hypothetical protein